MEKRFDIKDELWQDVASLDHIGCRKLGKRVGISERTGKLGVMLIGLVTVSTTLITG